MINLDSERLRWASRCPTDRDDSYDEELEAFGASLDEEEYERA